MSACTGQADELQPALQRMMVVSVAGSPADLDFKIVARSVRSRDWQELWRRVQVNCLHSAVNVHRNATSCGHRRPAGRERGSAAVLPVGETTVRMTD